MENDMGKKARIVIYIVSLLILAGMVGLIVATHSEREINNEKPVSGIMSEPAESTEEPIDGTNTIPETGESLTEEIEQNTSGAGGSVTADNTQTMPETGKDTTLIFTGDVLFANSFKNSYDAGGIEKVVAPELLQKLQDADILMINNEFPFSNRGTQMADKQFTFRCDPKYVKALQEMGVDIVSLANNHTLDYGREAFSDTFEVLDGAGILYAGAGNTPERAYELQVIEKNGKKFGFLAASRVIPVSDWKVEERAPGMLTAYDDTKLVELVKQAQSECDFLSVYLHWGVEYDAYPQAYQTKIAKDCFEAGANLVLGAHTHCLQGISYIDGKPVFYSLGNFIFGQSIEKTMAVELTVAADGTASYKLIPVAAAGGTTDEMHETKAAELFSYVQQISEGVSIGTDGSVSEKGNE